MDQKKANEKEKDKDKNKNDKGENENEDTTQRRDAIEVQRHISFKSDRHRAFKNIRRVVSYKQYNKPDDEEIKTCKENCIVF